MICGQWGRDLHAYMFFFFFYLSDDPLLVGSATLSLFHCGVVISDFSRRLVSTKCLTEEHLRQSGRAQAVR